MRKERCGNSQQIYGQKSQSCGGNDVIYGVAEVELEREKSHEDVEAERKKKTWDRWRVEGTEEAIKPIFEKKEGENFYSCVFR